MKALRSVLLPVVKTANSAMRKVTGLGHGAQRMLEWRIKPYPEWFDHFIDQHYQWKKTRIPFPWERGIFNLLFIKPGARALELCCGDGFNAHHFYSIRCESVLAVDFDPQAIAHARRHFKAPNVTFEVFDIRKGMPIGTYDNVLWDGAIEHFTEQEIDAVVRSIRSHLAPGGVLSGYTILNDTGASLSHSDHEYEFKSRDDLARFFTPHFKHVRIWQTDYPTRKNLYFFASDEPLDLPESLYHAQ